MLTQRCWAYFPGVTKFYPQALHNLINSLCLLLSRTVTFTFWVERLSFMIETVLFHSSVPLLREVPEETLAKIADVLEEVSVFLFYVTTYIV